MLEIFMLALTATSLAAAAAACLTQKCASCVSN